MTLAYYNFKIKCQFAYHYQLAKKMFYNLTATNVLNSFN